MGCSALFNRAVTTDLRYLFCCLGYKQAEACADGMGEEMMNEIDKEIGLRCSVTLRLIEVEGGLCSCLPTMMRTMRRDVP